MVKRKPRLLPSSNRRFGSIRILPNGQIRFSAWTVPGMDELQFMTHHRVIRVPHEGVSIAFERLSSYSVTVRWVDRQVLHLSVVQRRVQDAVFPYFLTPEELRHAVSVIRKVGNGLERWITPGLKFLQNTLNGMEPDPAREKLKPVVVKLLKSVRSIPLPKPWLDFQREQELTKQRVRARWKPDR